MSWSIKLFRIKGIEIRVQGPPDPQIKEMRR
jgi:hypothetical protein